MAFRPFTGVHLLCCVTQDVTYYDGTQLLGNKADLESGCWNSRCFAAVAVSIAPGPALTTTTVAQVA